jgi:hypothetical protein
MKGRKPGEAQAARKRHLVRQAIREKLILLKAGETVNVTAFGPNSDTKIREVTVRPLGEKEYPLGYVLAIYHRRLTIMFAYDKDGFLLDGVRRQINEVLGVVVTPME